MAASRLADRLDPTHNSFTLVRLALALLVIVSHSFVLATGNRVADPFTAWTGYSLGDHAVNVFFVLSGIVTTASLIRLRSTRRFMLARLLRVVPAVTAFAVLFALVVAPLVTTVPLSEYFASRDVAAYIVRTATFAPGHPLLPGVFTTNPMALITNEPLWTVKYEIICYILLAASGLLVLRATRSNDAAKRLFGFGAMAIIVAYVVTTTLVPITLPESANHLRRFLYCFALGMALFAFADKVRLDWRWLGVLVVAYAATFYVTPLRPAVSVLVTGYAALMLAIPSYGPLREITNRNDLSYGTYVLGWPVAQVLVTLVSGFSVVALTGATLAIVLPLAYLSWLLVERPSLALKHRFGASSASRQSMAPAE